MSWSQKSTGRPWLKVSQMRVLTFLGRALCHILAMVCGIEVLRRLRPWMKEIMCGVREGFQALM